MTQDCAQMDLVSYRKREQARVRVQRWRLGVKEQIDAYKLSHGCVDCGYREHAEALDFDHRRGEKVHPVARVKQLGNTARLWEEIEKCEVRCANCHRVRHAQSRAA